MPTGTADPDLSAGADRADAAQAEPRPSRWPGSRSVDILVFFGVLLVGFAYLWQRGDLDWVRSIAAGATAAAEAPPESRRRRTGRRRPLTDRTY